MVSSNYIGSSCDTHLNKEAEQAYENFMKDTFYCILCEYPHISVNHKPHSQCQIEYELPEHLEENY